MSSPAPLPLMAKPVDPDVQPPTSAPQSSLLREQGPVVGVVAIGGALGACARYGAALLWPTAPGAFPWTTLGVNAVGCAVIGIFMVVITEAWAAHQLVRPFFGTGVLGVSPPSPRIRPTSTAWLKAGTPRPGWPTLPPRR